jgi:UDP-N-acetyl-D-mannosaminuronate dehydrogenase
LKAGEDFGLAYYPLLDQTQGGAVKPAVAADDKYSLNAADLILEAATGKAFIKIPNVKVAELASLFAAVKRDVEAALANELAMFCETARIDYTEIAFFGDESLCKSSTPSISDEANRDETLLLLENAENLSMKLRIPAIARQVNEDMARHAVNLTQDALRSGGKTLRRARVALLGAAEPETAAALFAENLQAKGAKLSRYDPSSANDSSVEDSVALKKTLNETVEGADCVVVLSGQEQWKRLNLKKLHALMKLPAALVDLTGTVEPAKAEKEGFIYRGLGRGMRKK